MRISSHQPSIPPIKSIPNLTRLSPSEALELAIDMQIDVENMADGIAFGDSAKYNQGVAGFTEHFPKLDPSAMPGSVSQWVVEKLGESIIKPAFDGVQHSTDNNERLNFLSTIDLCLDYIRKAINKDP